MARTGTGGGIDQEEHLHGDNENPRKAVGLFARDSLGTGLFELSLLSTPSGVAIPTKTLDPAAVSVSIGNVTLNPSPNHIGSVTIYGTVQSTPGMTTLFGGPNQIGSVTVSNSLDVRSILSAPTLNVVTQPITVNSGMLTIFPGPNYIGLVTSYPAAATTYIGLVSVSGNVAVSNLVAPNLGNVTLNPSPNQIGSVTISNTVPVTGSFWQTTQPVSFGLVSLASGTEVRSLTTVLNFPATQPVSFGLVSLASGTEVRSLATILNFPATQAVSFGLVSLASGTEIRSLATVLNFPANQSVDIRSALSMPTLNVVTQAITVNSGMVTIFPGPNQIGSVTVSNFPLGLVSNATVAATFIDNIPLGQFGADGRGSLASGAFHPLQVDSSGYLMLGTNSRYIGLASVNVGNVVNSIVTIAPRTDYIGLVSVSGNVAVSNFVAPNLGNVTLNAGPNQIGSVTISHVVNSIATLAPRTDYLGLVSVSGNVAISNTINSLVTNSLARSITTSLATVISASGNSTIFVPPSGQRFFVHTMMLNAQGVTDGTIKSGTSDIWNFGSLATSGGFGMYFDSPGLPAKAADQSLVVNLNSAATVSVALAVHFE